MLHIWHAVQAEFTDLACTEATPTCGSTCEKLLPCGHHHCAERCHHGPCTATCRAITLKSCHCGKLQKQMPCHEPLRCVSPDADQPEYGAYDTALPRIILKLSQHWPPDNLPCISFFTWMMGWQHQRACGWLSLLDICFMGSTANPCELASISACQLFFVLTSFLFLHDDDAAHAHPMTGKGFDAQVRAQLISRQHAVLQDNAQCGMQKLRLGHAG